MMVRTRLIQLYGCFRVTLTNDCHSTVSLEGLFIFLVLLQFKRCIFMTEKKNKKNIDKHQSAR